MSNVLQAGLLNQSSAQVVDGSLKFQRANANYLTRAIATEGNRKTWTYSCWIKRDDFPAAARQLWGQVATAGASATGAWQLYYAANEALEIHTYSLTHLKTNAVYRDTGWYHVVQTLDTTRPDGDSRCRLYINGVEQTSFATRNNPSLDQQLGVNTVGNMVIGTADNAKVTYYIDAKMAQCYFIDGLALGPGYFGYNDPLTGTWRPKKFKDSGTTVNDGTTWSGYGDGNAASSFEWTHAFDGSFGANDYVTGTATYTTITFPKPIHAENIYLFLGTGTTAGLRINGVQITDVVGAYNNSARYKVGSNGEGNFLKTISLYNSGTQWSILYGIDVDGILMRDGITQNAGFNINPQVGYMYSDFGYGDFNGSNTPDKAFDGSTSTKAEPHDNDTVYFDFTHINSTGTLKNYNGNSRLPTYSNQGGLTAGDGLRTNPILNAFDGDSTTYCDMTYANGQYSRLTFEHPITNVSNITIGYDGEGDPGYNGGNHQTSVSFNGSRQTITLYSGGPITLENLDFISQPGSGVCRLYDISIATTDIFQTDLIFDGGITASSSLRMYMNKAGSPAASHFVVNGDDSGGSAVQSQLGGSVPSGDWLTISSIAKLKQVSMYHQSGSSSVELFAVEVDGTVLTDGTPATGGNSFYLPMDGNSPIGQDKSGNDNDFTPVNFGGSNSVDKATGAKPILNTTQGGSSAGVGVFGSKENKYYTVTTANGSVYQFDITSGDNPSLSFIRGATYKFDYSDHTGHPVLFSSTNPDSSTTAYTDGTSIASNVISFTVPHNAPDTLYYYCQNHPTGMNGAISVTTDETKADPYAWKCVLALANGTSDISNSINCTSTTKTVTNDGVAAVTTNSEFYGSSLQFESANTDSLTIEHADMAMGTGDFCVEFWVYNKTDKSYNAFISTRETGNGTSAGWVIATDNGADLYVHSNGAMAGGYDGDLHLPLNKWTHIAYTRSGGTHRLFMDGIASATASTTSRNYTEDMLVVGDNGYAKDEPINAEVQDVRVYKGVAKYTSNFIPASTNPDILPATPSGVSGSSKLTKITDGAVHFGANASDKLRFPDSNDMSFGTNDFTFETYYYHESQGSFDIMFDNLGSNRSGSQFSINGSGNYAIEIGDGSGNWVWQHTSQPARVKRWTHFAVTRQGSTFRAFVDGVQFATTTSSTAIGNPQRNAVGGYTDEDSSNYGFNGFLSNMRIVNGTAVYTKNFNPPSAPLTNVTNTKLLCCQSNTSATDALVSPSQSVNNGTVWRNYVTANYTMYNYDGTLAPGDGSTGFDGNLATRIDDWNGVYNSNYSYQLEFIPPSPISYSSSVEVYTVAGPQAPYNNEFFIDTGSGYGSAIAHVQNSWVTLASGSGSVSKIKTTADQNGTSWTAIRIDGIILIDGSTNGIIAHGDAAATNFNPFNTDINTVRGQETSYPTLNPLDMRASTALSNGNLTVTGANADWYLARSTQFVSTGKYYWEFKWYGGAVTGSSGYQMGLKTPTSTLTAAAEQAGSFAFQYGTIYQTAGSLNSVAVSPGSTSAGDTVMFAYDADAGKMWFGVNGIWNDGANPATGSNSDWTSLPTTGLAPFAGTYNSIIKIDCNFGQKPFKYAPPDGFQPINAANVRPETVIARPDQYVGVKTYTGTTGAGTIKGDNIKFTPDFVWLKSRSNSEGHALYDTVRGSTGGNFYRLRSDTNAAENSPTNELSSMIRGGFTVNNNGHCYYDGYTYAAWAWKAGGNKNTFNVDDIGYASAAAAGLDSGSITPTGASVGTKQGFSIIKWTGTRAADTVSHGLNSAVKFFFVKNLTRSSDWITWHTSLPGGGDGFIRLNTTGGAGTASTPWNSTLPTNSVFSLGADTEANGDGEAMIAYLWSDVPGLQKFGSFTGNGSQNFVPLDFRPALVWVKRAVVNSSPDSGNDYSSWTIMDSTRLSYNGLTPNHLFANKTINEGYRGNASSTSSLTDMTLEPLSNGFYLNGPGTEVNANTGTYIYCAWAEAPSFNLYGGQSNAR